MDPQIEATLRTWGLVHLGPKFEDEKIEWATFLELEDGDLKQLCSNLNDLVKLRKHHRLMRRQPEFWQDVFVTPPAETQPSEMFTVAVNRNRSGSPSSESRNVAVTMETEEMKIDENVAKIDMQKKEKLQARKDKRKQKKKQFRAERRRWRRQAKENAKAAAQDDNSASGSVATGEALPPSPSEGPVPGPVPTDGASPPSPSQEPVAEEMAETKTD
ncbi:uncharacterized protein LOC117642643 [Thrips palmi]|uniref:Uncharacterized protein LOC117642643 n=1 Tax=Thrips palmi TaxID=161013 RepID=A0A6P8YBF2_THRPL|nr:uncharacterized protein LOC117642643 [Thrips palmi]XP_034236931.1 uncharacterized protein LOC117642643 [Thrips palmi]XP_034236932.1 uncharacterized protein LOC117642643 [Thrips palmi]XP_034236933.1 uncharacterized protein LOC117642643 [Thrips palmi]XP_034236934.1 uncharacterized protein LOC117642643 [Thrips palmi]XP_034236935.1 uncharacterized protein LOC117642643 [Thrips palmi]XP_034236936.1 uncharacterized protein LOC117642643 [Thrips palmi]XP_034236937.1 uncharacterized protein LOC1176